MRFFTLVLFSIFCYAPVSLASSIRERIFFEGKPSLEQIRNWSQDNEDKEFIIRMEEALKHDLLPLQKMGNPKLLQIVVSRYPDATAVEAWQFLAAKGVELVLFSVEYPRENEVERLNKIGLNKIVFVMTTYPSMEQAERLSKLTSKVSLTFAGSRYPFDRFIEGPPFEEIDSTTPLLFIANYWPADIHVKFFNSLSQDIKLRIVDTLPGKSAAENILKILKLTDLAVEMDSDIPTSLWAKLPPVARLQWISRNWVPSAKSLQAFASLNTQGQERSITINSDAALSVEERERLSATNLPVLWIHKVN